MRIDVTADDILHGVRKSCSQCPLAYAFSRELGYCVNVHGGRATNYKLGDGRIFMCYLPIDAQIFMLDFDSGYPVEPFSFNVTPSI